MLSKERHQTATGPVIDANPFLKGMTARDAQVWAARKMTMKASDLAAQSVKVNEIEDPEVRALASKALQDRIKVRKAIEKAEAAVFDERLVQGDASLTEQEATFLCNFHTSKAKPCPCDLYV